MCRSYSFDIPKQQAERESARKWGEWETANQAKESTRGVQEGLGAQRPGERLHGLERPWEHFSQSTASSTLLELMSTSSLGRFPPAGWSRLWLEQERRSGEPLPGDRMSAGPWRMPPPRCSSTLPAASLPAAWPSQPSPPDAENSASVHRAQSGLRDCVWVK